MLNIVAQVSRYLLAIMIALYTIKCFTVFRNKYEMDRGSVYLTQNIIMFMIHFLMYLIIFLKTQDINLMLFYGAQVIFFIVTIVLHSVIYRKASRLLVNNMCFLMMIGFTVLTRLDSSQAIKQFMIAVPSMVIAFIIPKIIQEVKILEKLGILYGVLGIGVIASVFVFGNTQYGATNWIQIGPLGLQPSELAKVIFVFFVAAMFVKRTDFKYVCIISVVAAAHVLLLIKENDLGAAIIFFVIYIFMLYVGTGKSLYLFAGSGAIVAAALLANKFFYHVQVRVNNWINPWADVNGKGWQMAQSLIAISAGGWFGLGFYKGIPTDIPIVTNDFIFSAIVEELGILFGICLLLIYISCFIMFINISLRLTKRFYKLLAIGLSVSYAFQLFLTVGGVTKLIPHTGVTLPLISYGGSSILSTIIIFAVIQGLYLLRQKEIAEHEKEQWEANSQ